MTIEFNEFNWTEMKIYRSVLCDIFHTAWSVSANFMGSGSFQLSPFSARDGERSIKGPSGRWLHIKASSGYPIERIVSNIFPFNIYNSLSV